MKVAIVYTKSTEEMRGLLLATLQKELQSCDVSFLRLEEPHILDNVIANNGITVEATEQLMALFCDAVKQGAKVILNVCSSVGDIARKLQPLFETLGVSLVTIDEDMARTATQNLSRIGVVATLPTTLEPTCDLIVQKAQDQCHDVSIVKVLVEGVYGLTADQLSVVLTEKCQAVLSEVDGFVLAQGSMASAKDLMCEALQKPVFESISHGARRVAMEVNLRMQEETKA